MAQDTALLRYLLKGARKAPGSGSQRDLAFAFDGTDDYISSPVIGRTGYNMNVSGNVTTGSDGDGSYIWINGNRASGAGSNAQCAGSTTPAFNQGTSFTISCKAKVVIFGPSGDDGLFGSYQDTAIYFTNTGNLVLGINGATRVDITSTGGVTLGTAFIAHLVYDNTTQKIFAYKNGTLLNSGGTTAPATFATDAWRLGDGGLITSAATSANKYIYHACIRNKALTQTEIDADIALGNTTKNDPSIVAYYIPDNLQYNTQYMLNPKDLSNASWTKGGGITVTANTTVAPDGTTTADNIIMTGSATNFVNYINTSISGSTLASQTFIVKAFAKVTAGTQTFRLEASHDGVASYISSDFTATTVWQEFTFTQTFTSSTSGLGVRGGIINNTAGTGFTIDFWNVRVFSINETLRDESPNIGGYLGWKHQKVISARIKLGVDAADVAGSMTIINVPRLYLHLRTTNNTLQLRWTDGLVAKINTGSTNLGNGFRGKVHLLGVFYRTGSVRATKLYMNGILLGTSTATIRPPNGINQTQAFIGRYTSNYYTGNIRDTRIYTFTGSFTDADALAIYNGGEPTSAGVTKYLQYNPPVGEVGTTTQDQSPNDRDGTLNGGVTRDYI